MAEIEQSPADQMAALITRLHNVEDVKPPLPSSTNSNDVGHQFREDFGLSGLDPVDIERIAAGQTRGWQVNSYAHRVQAFYPDQDWATWWQAELAVQPTAQPRQTSEPKAPGFLPGF